MGNIDFYTSKPQYPLSHNYMAYMFDSALTYYHFMHVSQLFVANLLYFTQASSQNSDYSKVAFLLHIIIIYSRNNINGINARNSGSS